MDFLEFDSNTGTRVPVSSATGNPEGVRDESEGGDMATYWEGQSVQAILALLQFARIAGMLYGYYGLLKDGKEIGTALVAIKGPTGIIQFPVEPQWLDAMKEQIELHRVGVIDYAADRIRADTVNVIEALKATPVQESSTEVSEALLGSVEKALYDSLYPLLRFAPGASMEEIERAAAESSRRSTQEAFDLILAAKAEAQSA